MHLDLFTTLPSTCLLFFTLFALTRALPWSGADLTASYKPADYTARPTALPQPLRELVKKDPFAAQTCGWISGSQYSPVACESGSECVWDEAHLAVGCCPGGVCSTGIYTSCVDLNIAAQSASAPGVLTCSGTNVCYRVDYPEGYSQHGCGASSLAAFVDTTYSGMGISKVLNIVVTSISFATPASASSISSSPTTGTTTGTTTGSTTESTAESTTISSISSISTLTSVSSTATITSHSSVTSSTTPSSEPQKKSHAGIMAGVIIGALAGLFAFAALACCCFRRRAFRKQDSFIRARHEEKIKYLGNKTSLSTSSSRDSSDHDLPFVIPDILSQELDLEQQITSGGVVTSPEQGKHCDIQSARADIVSPLTPPQYQDLSYSALPPLTIHVSSSFEAHPGQPWPLAPVSPTVNATSALFSQSRTPRSVKLEADPEITIPELRPRGSYTELRRVQLRDEPYNSPTDSPSVPAPASTTSTLSPYVRPPTPPPRSPKRLDPSRQSAAMSLPRSKFHPDPTAPIQISQVELSKDVSPRQLRTQSYTGYSALKDEESSSDTSNSAQTLAMHLKQNPFVLPGGSESFSDDTGADAVTGTNTVSYNDTHTYVNTTATAITSPALKSKTRTRAYSHSSSKSPLIPAPRLLLYPPIRQTTSPSIRLPSCSSPSSTPNSTSSSAISNFSATSRYSRDTSGVHRSLTGRTLIEVPNGVRSRNGNGNGNGAQAENPQLSLIARKPLPTDSAVGAYNELIESGNLKFFMPGESGGVQEGARKKVGNGVAGAGRIESMARIEGQGSTKPGNTATVGLGNMGRVISKTERAANERWTIGRRPDSSDSAYVAPLRVVSRTDNGAAAGVPLLGMPKAGEGRRARVYDV